MEGGDISGSIQHDTPLYRRRPLNPGVRGYLRKVFPKVMRGLTGRGIIELNMQVDHIIAYVKCQARQNSGSGEAWIVLNSATGYGRGDLPRLENW